MAKQSNANCQAAGNTTKIEDEIIRLEISLENARNSLKTRLGKSEFQDQVQPSHGNNADTRHSLLLLSDSALPLGSFAFSSGLESYLAHHKSCKSFQSFLSLSIGSMASTAVPYVMSAYQEPASLTTLDNDFDASVLCTVTRRASISQGRALLSVWERSFRPATVQLSVYRVESQASSKDLCGNQIITASETLEEFSKSIKNHKDSISLCGHFPPLWAVVCRSRCISLQDTIYVFLLNHAKAVISAAVRASVLGPYAAQSLLASEWLCDILQSAVRRNWGQTIEEAGQCAPVLDLWVGRHERLYSRIFNS